MADTERNTCGSERPKYPPPPRSGNAFAAAVFASIPGLLQHGGDRRPQGRDRLARVEGHLRIASSRI